MTTALPETVPLPHAPLPVDPLPVDPWPDDVPQPLHDLALLYAEKLTPGATPELVAEIRSKTPTLWLHEQLTPTAIPEDLQLEATLATFPTLSYAGYAKRQSSSSSAGLKEQQLAAVLRATWTNRHVLETMTGFWHDHFNIAMTTGTLMWFAADYDDAVRSNALGRFSDLLMATAKSAAMMTYLNNAQSRGTNPNENYARELLELHTVGVDGGYTEDDVRQVALVLTGWGTTSTGTNDTLFGFAFHPEHHYGDGPLSVMDWQMAAMSGQDAIQQGESLLGYLATHPSTARFLSTKLVRRFLGDGDYPELIERLSAAYLRNNTAIGPWLTELVLSEEFLTSGGHKLRRPLEHLVSGLRGLRPTLSAEGGAQSLLAKGLLPLLSRLGQAPFTWPAPDGHPDEAAYWAASGSVLARWNGSLQIVSDSIQGLRFDVDGSFRAAVGGGTVYELVDGVAARLLVRRLESEERTALLVFLGLPGEASADLVDDRKFRVLCALVLSTHAAHVR